MEWIRISKSKLKIMLSAEDAKRYALNCENADYADFMTREAFRDILTDVGQETDFDATEDKVYIQMYPSKEGGCELFVTKLGLLLTQDDHEAPSSESPHADSVPKSDKRVLPTRKKSSSFFFTSLEHLSALCRRLASTFEGESEIWLDERGVWWLILTEEISPKKAGIDLHFVQEYGQRASTEKVRVFLPEHARAICPSRAVQSFQFF